MAGGAGDGSTGAFALNRYLYILLCAVLLLGWGCSTERRLQELDGRVTGLLGEAQGKQFGAEAAREEIRISDYRPWQPGEGVQKDGTLRLTLRGALELAAKHSRAYQTARETLYGSALSLVSAQHAWDWNPTNNWSALLGIRQEAPARTTFTTGSSVGFTKRLLSGGRLTGSLALNTLRYMSGSRTVSMSSLAKLTLTQPLLAGAGELVARESLTQAERNLIYALRTYVREREALLIKVADLYYNVLNAEADMKIGQMSYDSLKYSRDRSEAMGEGGRVTQIDVDQARQRLLNAESNLVTYREAVQTAKDSLKVALAIPLETEIEVDPADMVVMLSMDLPRPSRTLPEGVEAALRQRLDFATVRDRLEDAERAVKIAEDAMRAKLNLTASGTAGSVTSNTIHSPRFLDAEYSVGLEMDLPFDRTEEAIALKRALISREQRRRAIDESREELVQSLRTTWNNLRSYEQKVKIQKMSVALAEKRVENTKMLFEDGRIAIREYLDAQDDLSNARNSLTRQLVTHRMCWLRLLYQLDELQVDPGTLWTERLEVKSK